MYVAYTICAQGCWASYREDGLCDELLLVRTLVVRGLGRSVRCKEFVQQNQQGGCDMACPAQLAIRCLV